MAVTNVISGVDGQVRAQSSVDYETATQTQGSLALVATNGVAFVKAGSNYFCSRTYFSFNTPASIATDQVVSAATIRIVVQAQRGTTDDEMEVMKFFNSTDHTTPFTANSFNTSGASVLFNTVGNGVSDEIDVGTSGTHTFTLDSTGVAYLNTQIAAGDKSAFLLRCKGDFEAGGVGIAEPTGISTRSFRDFEESSLLLLPLLSVTHADPVSGYGHTVTGVASGNIANVKGVATANISKVNGV